MSPSSMHRAAGVSLCAFVMTTGTIARADVAGDYTNLVLSADHRTVRYFPLTNPALPYAVDLSPAHANGTITFPHSPVAGPFFAVANGGGASPLSPSATLASAMIGDLAPAVVSADGFTVIVWFRTVTTSPTELVRLYTSPQSRNGFELTLGRNTDWAYNPSRVLFAVVDPTGAFRAAAAVTPQFADGGWHMLAGRVRGGAADIFYDGVVQTSEASSSGVLAGLDAFSIPLSIGGQAADEDAAIAQVSLHTLALSDQQIHALWAAGNGYTGQAVFNAAAIQPWFTAARSQRVDAMVMGDSNLVFGVDGGSYGHQFGMAQGLRRVLPIYGSAVIAGVGRYAWVAPTNGISPFLSGSLDYSLAPPAPVAAAVPDIFAGFAASAAYAAEGTIIPGESNWEGPILWESSDFLFDFTSRLEFHFVYSSFAHGDGVIHPTVRLFDYPYTTLAGKSISTRAPLDGLVEDSLEIPLGVRACGSTYSIQLTDHSAGLDARGPFAFLYSRFIRPDVRAGAAMTPIWSAGGVGARVAADAFLRRATLSQLGAFLRQAVRHQPSGQERLLFQIIEGQNDVNDPNPALAPDGSTAAFPSYSLQGQKLNTLTVIERVRSAWAAQGYDPSRLCFVLGPYHPGPGDALAERIPYAYLRGWKELALEHAGYNIAAIDGSAISSLAEFTSGSWYHTATDRAHLNRAGYLNFGIRTWRALGDAAGAPTLGACCAADGSCVVSSADQCGPGNAMFQGGGTACIPGTCRQPLGACCYGSGACSHTTAPSCVAGAGVFQGLCVPCTLSLCPVLPQGACCLPDGACTFIDSVWCGANAGAYKGDNAACATGLCPQPPGACCLHVSCILLNAAGCASAGGRYAGNSSPCNLHGDNARPCCRADFDQSGRVTLQDLFGFLAAWFRQEPASQWLHPGAPPGIGDLFAFLTAWFTGCPT